MKTNIALLAQNGEYGLIAKALEAYPDGADKRALVIALLGLVEGRGKLLATEQIRGAFAA